MALTVRICLHVAFPLLVLCSSTTCLCSSTTCLDTQYEECLCDNKCGDFQFSYPFGKSNKGCGDPNFQLDCDDKGGHPLINIGGDDYHILEPSLSVNSSTRNMTVVRRDKCNFSANYSQFWWPGSRFHIRTCAYTSLSLWGHCNQSMVKNTTSTSWLNLIFCGESNWYFNLAPEATRFCQTCLKLPIKKTSMQYIDNETALLTQGFEITWDVDPNRDESCGACLKSNGICGYQISEPATFLCYCPDGTSHSSKCLGTGREKKITIVVGCSVGGVALTAIALVLFLRFYGKRRKPPPGSSISMVENFLREYAHEMPTRYSLSRLKKITNNFAEKLGEGGYGVVYKGKLPSNGALVAVKILDRHRHSETQFMNEVTTIGRVHHVNLVRLLGYCFESPTSALVYEYMLNGSLDKFLFTGKEEGQALRWEHLYSIALGAARGIAYLHQDCEKRIIHFDIKPHNILLDADFTPKVCDFGLAKLCGKEDDHISITAARGTPGYVAPEMCDGNTNPVTDKSDVYSFGMLLLEIVGGRKNIDCNVRRSSQFYFPEWAFKLLERDELGMRLRAGEMETEDEEKARRLTKVGLWCIRYNSIDRPSMSRVVQMLEGDGDDVTDPPLPFNPLAEPENLYYDLPL